MSGILPKEFKLPNSSLPSPDIVLELLSESLKIEDSGEMLCESRGLCLTRTVAGFVAVVKDRPGSLFQSGPGSAKSAGTGILPGSRSILGSSNIIMSTSFKFSCQLKHSSFLFSLN